MAGCQTPKVVEHTPPRVRKGTLSIPADARTLAGSYFCTIGDDWTMDLTLREDGTFRSELGGMAHGESTGQWRTEGSQITFSSRGTKHLPCVVLDSLQPMDILRYGTNWAFLLRPQREQYETSGICSATCLHNIKKQK